MTRIGIEPRSPRFKKDKGFHIFPTGICLKVNFVAWLEFELTYFEIIVQHFQQYTMKTSSFWWDPNKVDQAVMAMKGYFTLSWPPKQESHHQMQFSVIFKRPSWDRLVLSYRSCRPYKNQKYHWIIYMKAFFHKHQPGSLKLPKLVSNWMNISKLKPTPALIKRNFTIFSNTPLITYTSLRMDPRTIVRQRARLLWTKQFLRKLFQGKALSSLQKPTQ